MFMRLVVLLLLSLAVIELEAKIVETSHIQEIIPLIDEETWFLVDLDNCLFQAAQALGHANWFYDMLDQREQQGMSQDEARKDLFPEWVRVQKVCRVKPVEDDFVPALLALQRKGVCVMGLTRRQPIIADSTAKQVASSGFDFAITAPSKECFSVPAKSLSLYSQGILYVNDSNKKFDVFEVFLAIINKYPKKVVFIDDKRKNVEDLEQLAKYGIEYVGVHYTAIDHIEPVYDRKLAEFQYKFLDQIMSNEAAALLMDHGVEQ